MYDLRTPKKKSRKQPIEVEELMTVWTQCLKYKNNAFKQGVGIVATSQLLKNLSISGIARYDKIDGLWNLENKDVYTGKMVLVWRW